MDWLVPFSQGVAACVIVRAVVVIAMDYRRRKLEARRRVEQRKADEIHQSRPCVKCGQPVGHWPGDSCNACDVFSYSSSL